MAEQDELMQELAGEQGATVATIDPVPEQPENPLVVKPLPKKSAVKAANAEHSVPAGGKGFAITVRGEYYAQSGDGKTKVIKRYEHVFRLPELRDDALSVIVGKLLAPALRKKHADFINYRTHAIADVKALSADTPKSNNLQYMDRAQLEEFVKTRSVPLDPKDFPETQDLRAMVIEFVQRPEGFEARLAEKVATMREDRELAAMNDLEVEHKPVL